METLKLTLDIILNWKQDCDQVDHDQLDDPLPFKIICMVYD